MWKAKDLLTSDANTRQPKFPRSELGIEGKNFSTVLPPYSSFVLSNLLLSPNLEAAHHSIHSITVCVLQQTDPTSTSSRQHCIPRGKVDTHDDVNYLYPRFNEREFASKLSRTTLFRFEVFILESRVSAQS